MNLEEVFSGFNRKNIFYLSLFFVLFYLLSLMGWYYPLAQDAVFLLAFFLFIILCFWRLDWALIFLLIEFLFGQAGHFFEFSTISIRLAFLVCFLLFWLIKKIGTRKKIELIQHKNWKFLLVFLIFVFLAFLHGYLSSPDKILVLRDTISYSFFLLIFPLYEFFKKSENTKIFLSIAVVAIVGVSVFTLLNFIAYSLHLSIVHDSYYWWLRNVLVGKATDLGNGFFRIVLPAHLWMLPSLVVLISLLFSKNQSSKSKSFFIVLSVLLSLSLLINFSRAYLLGLLIGFLFLKIGLKWRAWGLGLLLMIIILLLEINGLCFLANHRLCSQNFLLGRATSVVQPEEELSSLTRLRILPDLKNKISHNLFFGVGLGAQVQYLDPLDSKLKTTSQIDWGWLEILLELGLFGFLAYLLFLINLTCFLILRIRNSIGMNQKLAIGALGGLISLLVANLTGPFLFHPLGIFYQVLLFCWI